MPLPALLPLLGILSSPVTEYLKSKKEIKMAKHGRDLAIINNQAVLAQSKESHNSAWELENLKDKDVFLRRACFFMVTYPLVSVVVSPEHAAVVIERLDVFPQWIIGLYVTMFAGIWGAAELKGAGASAVAAWVNRKK